MNRMLLTLYDLLYRGIARPVIFRKSAVWSHKRALELMRYADQNPALLWLMRFAHRLSFEAQPVQIGGVELPLPYMLAAGWVKGDGFDSEESALEAVRSGRNIIPGWRSIPALLGLVEFGSFTRWPRLGNEGTVIWRNEPTRSTQNRVGLKNPGVEAAAEFLAAWKALLPEVYGINIAVTPGVDDPAQQKTEILESIDAFLRRDIIPAWFTLNLSCPNTEDDPAGNQSGELAEVITGAVIKVLGDVVPLWVKIGPTLADQQVSELVRAFAETGVRAVIATNTLPGPTPDDPSLKAGFGGGRLHASAVEMVQRTAQEIAQNDWSIDVIGCGGVEDGQTYRDFSAAGAAGVQYLSALIYRGPLAAALVQKEVLHG